MKDASKWEKPHSKQGERTYLTGSLPRPFLFSAAAENIRSARRKESQRTVKIIAAPAENQIINNKIKTNKI